MSKVTKLLLVASVAALGAVGFNACGDSVTVVEPAPVPPPEPPVIPPIPGTEPSIQIASITNVAGNVINPANVFGQINVTLNVEPGTDNTLQKVAVLVDGVEVASQTFSSASVSSKSPGVSASAAPTQIILPYDTRTPNTAGDRYLNGGHSVTATMTTSAGSLSAAEQSLTFANANIIGSITFTGNSFTTGAGVTWYGNDDIVATCSATVYQSVGRFNLNSGPFRWSTGSASTNVTPDVGDDQVATASATMTKSRNTTAEGAGVVACNYPSTSAGWDTDGDGVSNGAAVSITRTLRLDNVPPAEPAAADYTFRDARIRSFDPATTGAPINSWANAGTAFGFSSAALDGGVGGVTGPVGPCTFDGFNVTWVCSGSAASGADLSETTTTTTLRIGPTGSIMDALGNTQAFEVADYTTCAVCSNTFGIDKTMPTISSVRPPGAVYNPGAGEEVTTFTARDSRSGLDWDNAGVLSSNRASIEVDHPPGGGPDCDVPDALGACTLAGAAEAGTGFQGVVIAYPGIDAPPPGTNLPLDVTGQIMDQAGNLMMFPGVSTVTDNIAPAIALTTTPAGAINATGVSSIQVTIAGSITDANGLSSASISGFLNNGALATTCSAADGDVAFTAAQADQGVVDLGAGGTFSVTYTLFAAGASMNPENYCWSIAGADNATSLTGSAAGANTSATSVATVVTW